MQVPKLQVVIIGAPEKIDHSAIETYPSLDAPIDRMIIRNDVYVVVDVDHTVKDCF
jgi:hypothetical protein